MICLQIFLGIIIALHGSRNDKFIAEILAFCVAFNFTLLLMPMI